MESVTFCILWWETNRRMNSSVIRFNWRGNRSVKSTGSQSRVSSGQFRKRYTQNDSFPLQASKLTWSARMESNARYSLATSGR